jgi:hypothetical protein
VNNCNEQTEETTMKTALLGILTVSLLMFATVPAQADDRGFRGHDGNAGWRLGERTRDGYAIYRRDRGNWYRVPGAAIAVADGWVLGAQRESGGHAIYRWNGYGWDQAPGGAVEIGGSYARPWVVNNRGERFNWNGYDWNRAGYVGRPASSFKGNAFGRDRNRDRYDRGRDRDRFPDFGRRDREWDPYRYDSERRHNERYRRW